MDERARDHLERLAERNRIRQSSKDLSEARREERLRSLEKGFETCFSGANADRVTQKKIERERQLQQHQLRLIKRGTAASRPAGSDIDLAAGYPSAAFPAKAAGSGSRRGWQQSTVTLMAQDGQQLRLRPFRPPDVTESAQLPPPPPFGTTPSGELPPAGATVATGAVEAPSSTLSPAAGPEQGDTDEGTDEEYEDDFENDEGGGSLRATLRALKASIREEELKALLRSGDTAHKPSALPTEALPAQLSAPSATTERATAGAPVEDVVEENIDDAPHTAAELAPQKASHGRIVGTVGPAGTGFASTGAAALPSPFASRSSSSRPGSARGVPALGRPLSGCGSRPGSAGIAAPSMSASRVGSAHAASPALRAVGAVGPAAGAGSILGSSGGPTGAIATPRGAPPRPLASVGLASHAPQAAGGQSLPPSRRSPARRPMPRRMWAPCHLQRRRRSNPRLRPRAPTRHVWAATRLGAVWAVWAATRHGETRPQRPRRGLPEASR